MNDPRINTTGMRKIARLMPQPSHDNGRTNRGCFSERPPVVERSTRVAAGSLLDERDGDKRDDMWKTSRPTADWRAGHRAERGGLDRPSESIPGEPSRTTAARGHVTLGYA